MLWALCEPVFGRTGPNAGLVEQSLDNVPTQRPGKMLCAPRGVAGRKLHRRCGRGLRIDRIAGTPIPGPAEKSVLDQKEAKGKAEGANKHKHIQIHKHIHIHIHSRIANSSGASCTLFIQQKIKIVVVNIITIVTIQRKK